MFKSLQVSNFRSLRDVKLQKLKRLNLVTGSNGGGKTSLLEAVFLNAGAANPHLALSINSFRGDNIITPSSDHTFRSWFWELDQRNPVRIVSDVLAQGRTRSRTLLIDPLLRSQFTPGRSDSEAAISGVRFNFTGPSGKTTGSVQINPPLTAPQLHGQSQPLQSPVSIEGDPVNKDTILAQFISPYIRDMYQEVSDQLVEVIKSKNTESLIDALTMIEPNVKGIVPITKLGQPNIYIDTGLPRLLPLHVLGSGFLHILRLSLAQLAIQDGIIIVDELEDGLHFSIMPKVVKRIIDSVEHSKAQYFIATHSSDLLKIFIDVSNETQFDDICLVNLIGGSGGVNTRYFDHSELALAEEYGAELR